MFSKSYTTKLLLAIIPVILITGYFERFIYLLPQYFSKSEVYATNSELRYDNNVELPEFKTIPVSLIEKIKGISVETSKVNSVKSYLSQRNSPLASKAKFLVQSAKYFGIDYRLVAAISIIESSGGIHTYRPYNAWGWGGAEAAFTFKNWEEAIVTVSRGLGGYYARGADTPREIAPTYNPHTPNEWSSKVTHVMALM